MAEHMADAGRTKTGTVSVYVIACGDCVKIGISCEPDRRLRDMKTALAERPYIVATRAFPSRLAARRIEKLLHWQFRGQRAQGEWFRVPAQDARAALKVAKPPSHRITNILFVPTLV